MRGSRRTTIENAAKFYWDGHNPDPDHIMIAGIPFPTEEVLDKLNLVTGLAGTGKSLLLQMILLDYARLMNERQRLTYTSRSGTTKEKQTRALVIDFDYTMYGMMHSAMSDDVEFVYMSPQQEDNVGWDIKGDIGCDHELWKKFIEAIFPRSLQMKANDPFWIDNAMLVLQAIFDVFVFLGSEYRVEDFFIPIAYPQLLQAFLEQSPETVYISEKTLKGKAGKDIAQTLIGRVSHLLVAAGYMQKATNWRTLRSFLESPKSILHLGYSTNARESLGHMYNVMLSMLVALCVKNKNDLSNDLTTFFCDEMADLADIGALDIVARVGRKHGMGAIVGALSIEALNTSWSEQRTKEYLSYVNTFYALRSSLDTARYFSELVGQYEAFNESYSTSYAENKGTSEAWGNSGGHGNYNYSVTMSYNWQNTSSIALSQRPGVLTSELVGLPTPNLKRGHDNIIGKGFNGTLGLFNFNMEGAIQASEFMQRRLSGSYLRPQLRPPQQAKLLAWSKADLKRLKIRPTTEMMNAMRQV